MTDRRGLPFDELPDPPVPPVSRPLTVSELTAGIRHVMEGTFNAVAVEGEISNCRQWSSGHLYFTLKDDRAQLRAVMFRTTVRTLKFTPEDDQLLVDLKEKKNLTWKQIADFFPGRSSGTLQVRYCTKLKAKTTVWTDEMVSGIHVFQTTLQYAALNLFVLS